MVSLHFSAFLFGRFYTCWWWVFFFYLGTIHDPIDAGDVLCPIKYDKQSQEPTKYTYIQTHTYTITNSQHMHTAATKLFAICMICLYLDSFSCTCCALTWRWLALLDYNSPQYQSPRCDTSKSKRLYFIKLLPIVIYICKDRKQERNSKGKHKMTYIQTFECRRVLRQSRLFKNNTQPNHRAFLLMFWAKICTGLQIARRSYHCESQFVPVSHLKAFRIQWHFIKNRINT